jgi:hypothetical protein
MDTVSKGEKVVCMPGTSPHTATFLTLVQPRLVTTVHCRVAPWTL